MSDDWLDGLDDLGIGTPPQVIDAAVARMTPGAAQADAGMLYLWATLHLLRAAQASMIPGRFTAPGDLDEAVRAGETALRMLREHPGASITAGSAHRDEGEAELEAALLQIVAEALTLRDAPGDLDRAIAVTTETARRYRPASEEWAHATNELAHRHLARYLKDHRAADFTAAEHALLALFDTGWPDRPSLWQRHGSLYEERFRRHGDYRDHWRALEILRAGWAEGSRFPLLALSFADTVVNSGTAEPAAADLDAAARILSEADLGELPPPMLQQYHHLVMTVQFRRHETEATVRAADRLVAWPGTEPVLRAEARWVRASARLQQAARARERMAPIDEIIADLAAAAPLLNPGARRIADAQLTRMLAERARRTGNRKDAEESEAYAREALDRMPRGTAERTEVQYHLAFQLVRRGRADEAIDLLEQVVAAGTATPSVRAAAAAQLATSIAWLLHHRGGDPARLDRAITLAHDALEGAGLDDMNRVALAAGLAGVLLMRFEMRGDLADLRWSLDLLHDARHEAPDDPNRYELLLSLGQAQLMWAEITGSALPADTPALLTGALALIPADDPARVLTLRSLGAAYALLAERSGDRAHWEEAVGYARQVLAVVPSPASMRISAGGTLVLAGRAIERFDLVREGVDLIGGALEEPVGEMLRGRHLALYGTGLVALLAHERRPSDLVRAVAALRAARDLAAAQPGQRGAAEIGMALSVALQLGDDPLAAAEAGRLALRERAWQVLVQSGTHDAMTTARRSSPEALQIARILRDAGDLTAAWQTLETGRGLVLHAATVAATVPDLLRAAGESTLAEQWSADPSAALSFSAPPTAPSPPAPPSAAPLSSSAPPSPAPSSGAPSSSAPSSSATPSPASSVPGGGAAWRSGMPAMPSDARFRALQVLAGEAGLFDPPPVEQVGAALRALGADALVYLFPGTPGFALLVLPDGGIETLDLPALTGDWSAPAAVQSALATRERTVAGSALPDSTVSGSALPGSALPGSALPGSALPGSAVSGSAAPGSAGPGSAAPGSAASGSAGPGSAALGSAPLGSAAAGSAAADLVAGDGATDEPAVARTTRDLGPAGADAVVGRTLGEVCRAAWDVAMRPLLDHWRTGRSGEPHFVFVTDGALATVPWHAAHGDGRWAIDEAAFSYIASGRLLVEVARRPAPARGDTALVIGNPDTGDTAQALPNAGAEASTIFRKHYPAGRFCGRPAGPDVVADGPGLPADVLGWLDSPAPVLHLACHGVIRADGPASSYLLLADGTRVSAEELLRPRPARTPGLVSLAACTTHRAGRAYDEAVTLSTGFLVAGATTAIGSLWPVPDVETAHLMVAFHDNLAGAGMPPHAALREAQRSIRDPDDDTTLTHWAGFVHLGR